MHANNQILGGETISYHNLRMVGSALVMSCLVFTSMAKPRGHNATQTSPVDTRTRISAESRIQSTLPIEPQLGDLIFLPKGFISISVLFFFSFQVFSSHFFIFISLMNVSPNSPPLSSS